MCFIIVESSGYTAMHTGGSGIRLLVLVQMSACFGRESSGSAVTISVQDNGTKFVYLFGRIHTGTLSLACFR